MLCATPLSVSTFAVINASIQSGILHRLTELLDGPVCCVASVTSEGRAWLTSRLVSERGSMSSRSATVRKQLRSAWNQNFAPPDSRVDRLRQSVRERLRRSNTFPFRKRGLMGESQWIDC